MHQLKKISYSLKLDLNWLQFKSVPLWKKVFYIAIKYHRLLMGGGNSIPYLNQEHFLYDNQNTPATLQSYPDEINFLNKWVNFSYKNNILDVGANIGQFAVTIASMFPTIKVYAFEPNPNAFQLLTNNSTGLPIECFNYAIGAPGEFPFYFVPGYSGKGSFIASNACINLGNVKTSMINVDAITLNDETIEKIGIPQCFDLIKIDVEGFEYEVLNALAGVKSKYIYIEFSIGRPHSYTFPELIKRMTKIFGPIDVLYCDRIDISKQTSTIGNILVMTTNQT